MVGARPPEQCGRCAGRGYLWTLMPNGEWKVQGKCPECGGTGRPKAKEEGEQDG